MQYDEEELLEDFRTLSWTRLLVINAPAALDAGYEAGQRRNWPLGPDVVAEVQAVANLQAVDEAGWAPLFEPVDFNEAHGSLQLEEYR